MKIDNTITTDGNGRYEAKSRTSFGNGETKSLCFASMKTNSSVADILFVDIVLITDGHNYVQRGMVKK